MDPQASGTRTWQWVVTIIVIIVLIVIGILVFGGKGSENGDVSDVTDTDTSSNIDTTAPNRITMTDQYPGNVVFLSSVQLEKPGYVAIHEDASGKPGKVIGYAKFDKGINPGRITLTSPLIDGKMYYAILHNDDGDNVFDETKDAAIKDANGNVIMKTFRASSAVNAGIKG